MSMERRLAAIMVTDVVGYSRLIRADEEGTLAALKSLRADLIYPKIDEHHGRVVKLMGDGMLAEFASVTDALRAAAETQRAVFNFNADLPEDKRIEFRVGINLGDVVIDGDDIQGDGVNVAARLEVMAEPGGICVSDVVYQSTKGKTGLTFDDLGEQRLKNIDTPIRVWRWALSGAASPPASSQPDPAIEQQIKFCTAPDGVNIAYAVVGEGPPLVKAPNWMNHLEYDWQSPVWRHLLRGLAAEHSLVRFDQRANGLSDWDVAEITFERMVDDMAAVVDAVGLTRFPLIGISQGCSYSIAYAIRHPERVSRLILYGGFAKGRLRSGSEIDRQQHDMQTQMIRQGWGRDNPAFRQFFTSLFIPGATKEQMDWFNELQRTTTSPENAARLRDVSGNIDVSDLLGQIAVPTLVLHCRDDGIVPFEKGRRMAAMIPNARFVALEGRNHLILEDEPAWPRFMKEISAFLAQNEA
jgi:class 3 adenylate cyclase/pimeloyl-ACP methyl ester carboxylesterase